jgi:chorismate mutase
MEFNSMACKLKLCSFLKAISKRIHYGKFVAEAKFRENPLMFEEDIRFQACIHISMLFFLFGKGSHHIDALREIPIYCLFSHTE